MEKSVSTENNSKAPRFLRWPWNIVVYLLLAVVFRIFAIPLILVLAWFQNKQNPHGAAEGYCLSRTRKQLKGVLWSLLFLFIGAALAAFFYVGWKKDHADWDRKDIISLIVSGLGAVVMTILSIYQFYTSLRDTFFPGKSRLAKSIREQLPYPEEAPPVKELFAMVDKDLEENGLWFDSVGIGKEWVLGDMANRIDRIRGIFTVDRIHQHNTQTGIRSYRTLELVLIDNRWKKSVTTFYKPKELQAAAEYLSLKVPGAVHGKNLQYADFLAMDENQRETFERKFMQTKS